MRPKLPGRAGQRSRSRTVRVGLTGPIGCGKSTVAGWLAGEGAVVIDADRVARQVTEPGTPALDRIAATFGRGLLRDDGSLDRAALGRIVFADPQALADLEAIVHPAVRLIILEEMAAAERDGAMAIVVEAIKLVEGGLADLCDEVWLVTCSPDEQRARVVARGVDAADAEARILAQGDITKRLRPEVTRVVDTSGTPGQALRRVRAAWLDAMESTGA